MMYRIRAEGRQGLRPCYLGKGDQQSGHTLTDVKGSEVVQSCPTLCDPIDCSLPGFSIYGIFRAGVGCHFLLPTDVREGYKGRKHHCPVFLHTCSEQKGTAMQTPLPTEREGKLQLQNSPWASRSLSGSLCDLISEHVCFNF